jgi:hypothetical protein
LPPPKPSSIRSPSGVRSQHAVGLHESNISLTQRTVRWTPGRLRKPLALHLDFLLHEFKVLSAGRFSSVSVVGIFIDAPFHHQCVMGDIVKFDGFL